MTVNYSRTCQSVFFSFFYFFLFFFFFFLFFFYFAAHLLPSRMMHRAIELNKDWSQAPDLFVQARFMLLRLVW